MRRNAVFFFLAVFAGVFANHAFGEQLTWDASTLVLVQRGGAYGRMLRPIADQPELICCFEHRRRVCIRKSGDDGKTWGPLIDVAGYEFGSANNPELLECANGRLLMFFNGRPKDGQHLFTIQMASSSDDGATWVVADRPIYATGTHFGDGCYEPAAVQLPGGEILMFFSNERGHEGDGTQEIDLCRSEDAGQSWTAPAEVSYRAGGRDGMPVPMISADGASLLVAIEDNGLMAGHQLQPAILRMGLGGADSVIDGGDARRWAAVSRPAFAVGTYAGAPYLREFPNHGPTVLTCQPAMGPGHVQRLAVFLGDAQGRDFGDRSEPMPVDAGKTAQWNALLIKKANTVTVISTTTIRGVYGVWAIDGRLVTNP